MTRSSTGPSPETRLHVINRSGGACEKCGRTTTTGSVHHRRPRGMGGTKHPAANDPANLLVLCGSGVTGCHGWVETHRDDAYARGLLLRTGMDAQTTPYLDDTHHWWLLHGTSKIRLTMPY